MKARLSIITGTEEEFESRRRPPVIFWNGARSAIKDKGQGRFDIGSPPLSLYVVYSSAYRIISFMDSIENLSGYTTLFMVLCPAIFI